MSVSNSIICSFAFQNRSERLQSKLHNAVAKSIISPSNVQKYLDELVKIQPQYILGLGTYSGRDQDQLRIESTAKNKFRNKPITNSKAVTEQQHFVSFLRAGNKMKYATAMGNSWCNLISWKIVELIQNGKLKSHYTFVHIPKDFPISEAAEIINDALLQLEV